MPITRRIAPLVLAAASLIAGCAETAGPNRALTIDGDLADWGQGVRTTATQRAIYFRFSPGAGEPVTLQAGDETTALIFDLDDDSETGEPLYGPPDIGTLGVDLEILLSPPLESLAPAEAQRMRASAARSGATPRAIASGITIIRHDGPGRTTHLKHADIGLVISPTYASDSFEARINRTAPALANTGLAAAGAARGIVLVTDEAGEVIRYSDPLVFELPQLAAATPLGRTPIPPQADGTIRVMSMNVLHGKPIEEPAPFARLIAAIQPDVILFQEADDITPERFEAWLSGFVGQLPAKHDWANGVQTIAGGAGSWDAAADPDAGIAIATPHLISSVYDEPVTITDPESGRTRYVRVLTAMVSTPLGDVLAASTHLKCCGSAGSREDTLRYAEAEAINQRFGAIADSIVVNEGRRLAARIIGGDLNLVGTRGPLETLAENLAGSGMDLQPVDLPVLDSDAWYTWRNDRSSFGPGRLDWILVGDARVEQAFALDTRLLDPDVLAALGLQQDDSGVSDHLPVVVDLKP